MIYSSTERIKNFMQKINLAPRIGIEPIEAGLEGLLPQSSGRELYTSQPGKFDSTGGKATLRLLGIVEWMVGQELVSIGVLDSN